MELRIEEAKEKAQVTLSGKPRIRPEYYFPAAETEIYFDIGADCGQA
jgi:hypothetical protein